MARIGALDLLRVLFDEVIVPPAVVREFGATRLREWIVEHRLVDPIDRRISSARLDAGEREAIALALELRARWIVLDELPARRLAKRLGLPVIGTVGILSMVKWLALLPEVRPTLEALIAVGFYIHPALFRHALVAAGE